MAFPAVCRLRHGDAERGEDALDFGLGDRLALVDNEQVHGALDIGEVRSIPGIDTNQAITPGRMDRLAGCLHSARLTHHPLDEVAFRSPEGGGEPAISGTDMDDEPAFHRRLLENGAGQGSRVLRRRGEQRTKRSETENQQGKKGFHLD